MEEMLDKIACKGVHVGHEWLYKIHVEENTNINRIIEVSIYTDIEGIYHYKLDENHVGFQGERFHTSLWWNDTRWKCIGFMFNNNVLTAILDDKKLNENIF